MATGSGIGCLLIDDILNGEGGSRELAPLLKCAGVLTRVFEPVAGIPLYPSLQRAWQSVRMEDGVSSVMAWGSGCDAALALAGQLPVDRLILAGPSRWRTDRTALSRTLGRIRRYALRGAAFCVAGVWVIPGPGTDDALPARLSRALFNCPVAVAGRAEDLCTERKEVMNSAVLHFLRRGELPKSLAENPEMCIIYG